MIPQRASGRAFTLTELLVVIIIFAIVLALAAPAVLSIVASSERAQAENQLTVALGNARSVAMSSDANEDAAAVFFFDPNGRTRIVLCTRVGEIADVIEDANCQASCVTRDVFVPLAQFQPIHLPRGWSVRAYAPPGSLHHPSDNANGWYKENPERVFEKSRGNWIAPETGYYDGNDGDDGRDRQTFMVRFSARTGTLSVNAAAPSVVLDPSTSSVFRKTNPWKRFDLSQAESLDTSVRRLLARRTDVTDAERQLLLGDQATDTVLTRPVSELALFSETALAGAVGARGLNRATGSLYGITAQRGPSVPTEPRLDSTLFTSFSAIDVTTKINNWMQASSAGSSEGETKASDVLMYVIDRYSGVGREVSP